MILLVEFDPIVASTLTSAMVGDVQPSRGLDTIRTDLAAMPEVDTVVLGPSVDQLAAFELARSHRVTRPELGVVLVRRRVDTVLLTEALRAGIREVVADRDLTQLTSAVTRSQEISRAFRRGESGDDEADSSRGQVITVFSAKGGCGKTTVATNLAAHLAKAGHGTVALVDLDLAFGDVAIAMQLEPERTIADTLTMGDGMDGAALLQLMTKHKSGAQVLAAPPDPALAEKFDEVLVRDVLGLLAHHYDYVVIDTPPALDGPTLAAFDESNSVALLTTLDIPSLKNTKLTLETLKVLGYPQERLRLVLNRADSKVGLNSAEVSKALGMPVSAGFPSTRDVPASTNKGEVLSITQPKHGFSIALAEFARESIVAHDKAANTEGDRPARRRFLEEEMMSLADRISQARRERQATTEDTRVAGEATTHIRAVPDDPIADLKAKVHAALLETLGNQLYDSHMAEDELSRRVRMSLQDVLAEEETPLSTADRTRISQEIADDILGYGPIEPYLRDPEVTEVMVNGPAAVFVESRGRLTQVPVEFDNDAHIRRTIDKIVNRVGRRIDESSPMVDARLPDGSRVNAIIPPLAVDSPVLTIRKFATEPYQVDDLLAFGTVSESVAEFLAACVKGRLNILVSGGTGAGKTTTLNVLSSFIPEEERIVTIEDAAELQLHQDHVVRLEYRPRNIEGKGEVKIRDLVKNSLRMRPDRIVVGEVRDAAALDMLQAMNTGHDGSICTAHSNSPRDSLARVETMVLTAGVDLPIRAIREQMASALDLVVHQTRLRDGTRRITHVTEVVGMEGDTVTLQDLFVFDFDAGVDENGNYVGQLRSTGLRPKFLDKLRAGGVDMKPEIFAFERFGGRK